MTAMADSFVFNDEEYDDYDDEFTDSEQGIIALASEIGQHSRSCIVDFFASYRWHCGGPIPLRELITQEKIDFIEQADFSLAVDLFHEAISVMADKNPNFKICGKLFKKGKNYDVILLLKLLDRCMKAGIPQNRAGGIVLIYLDVVVGIPLDWPVMIDKMRQYKQEHLVEEQQSEDEVQR
jgi:hypothetical protein